MLIRFLQIGIVVLWLGSTSWLVREVWFPAESRFAVIDSDEAIQKFFEWNESTNLILLEAGRRIGVMTINGYSGVEKETGEYVEGLSLVVSFDPFTEENRAYLSRATWNGTLDFDEKRELKEAQFSFRLPSRELNAHLRIEGEPLELTAQLKFGHVIVFEIERPVEMDPAEREGQPLPGLPENLPFGLSEAVGGIGGDIGSWVPEIEARRGTMKLAGRGVPVYLLNLVSPNGYKMKAWLSEAGEPLRIESSWGHEALAEVLAPIEALEQSQPSEKESR